jgi:hypothetical protein
MIWKPWTFFAVAIAGWMNRQQQEAISYLRVENQILREKLGHKRILLNTAQKRRLAVGEPDLNIGHVDNVLDALTERCYYLSVERNRYRFSPRENLIKKFTDRKASIAPKAIDERVRAEIQKVFAAGTGVERVYFPEKSNSVADRPALTLAILSPEVSMEEAESAKTAVKTMTWECGRSGRTFKSGIIWCVAESGQTLKEEAKRVLAWEAIKAEDQDRLDESQVAQLDEQLKRGKRDLQEVVWRGYKYLLLLGKDNEMRTVDLGLVNSSQAATMVEVVLKRLREDGDLEKSISPNFLVRRWPGFVEWSTKSVRDAFFASPEFPRLLNADGVKETIARGVSQGLLAYVGKKADGRYKPFVFEKELTEFEVEISDDMFIITAEEAKKHVEPPKLTQLLVSPQQPSVKLKGKLAFQVKGIDQFGRNMPVSKVKWKATGGEIDSDGNFKAGEEDGQFSVSVYVGDLDALTTVIVTKKDAPPPPPPPPEKPVSLHWSGEIPAQKWMNFYTKVLAKFATGSGLKVTVTFDIAPGDGVTQQRVDETKSGLRELGLDDDVTTSGRT